MRSSWLTAGSMALVTLVACGGSTNSYGNSSSGAAGSGATGGSTGQGVGGSNGSSGAKNASGRNAMGECGSSSSTQACVGDDAYEKCLVSACDAKLSSCFGEGYATMNYGGICGSAMNCYVACPCGDFKCENGCFQNTSSACQQCSVDANECIDSSGCPEPVCGGSGSGGGGAGGAGGGSEGGSGGAAEGGSGGGTEGGSGGAAEGGSGGGSTICPYTVQSFGCPASCEHLKTIAAKCKDDPTLSDYTKAVLAGAAAGNGTGCKATCAVDSASYPMLWACFQGVPLEADCTAIAGCTMGNCL
jgi:hypothetical protein